MERFWTDRNFCLLLMEPQEPNWHVQIIFHGGINYFGPDIGEMGIIMETVSTVS